MLTKNYPTLLELLDLGYSDEEARNIVVMVGTCYPDPEPTWKYLRENAPSGVA